MTISVGEGLTREERETHIIFHEGSDTLTVSTASPVFVRKLEKLCMSLGVEVEYRSMWDIRATWPVTCLKLNKPIHLSDAERERRAAAMRERRARQVGAGR